MADPNATRRHTVTNSRLLATALVAVLASGTFAHAQTAPVPPAPPFMDVTMLLKHLSSLGFGDVREIERKSDKLYEVTARDAEGLRWEMSVDARTGEILRKEPD
ncbi:PepSY domain-containing protein [Azospirillum thermophilum]|nr:PepSY domain-containing protein [Azospirillum thermophilum]